MGYAVAVSGRLQDMSYRAPTTWDVVSISDLIDGARKVPESQLPRMALRKGGAPNLYIAGDPELARRRLVSIVGSRRATDDGKARARKLAQGLVSHGIVVVSGLAEGIDTAALEGALDARGRVVAVIGTPLARAYPASNAVLQQTVWAEHLLISPFPQGYPTSPRDFPHRNKIMAAISDATVIIEASDTSGSLHQAAECQPSRLNRPLFIARSVVNNPDLTWPKKFVDAGNVHVLTEVEDVLAIFR
jgi:DNA processing protein